MKTADVVLAAFFLNPDPGAGREPLPQGGAPFGDLLSLMDGSSPAPRQEGGQRPDHTRFEVPEPDATESIATGPRASESLPRPPAAQLDQLLAHCAHPGPERTDSDTPVLLDAARSLPLPDAAPVAAEDTEADAESDAPVCTPPAPDTISRAMPVPPLAMPPAPGADVPAPDAAPRDRAHPVHVPLPAPAGPDAPSAPMGLAVLRQETHFTPVRPHTHPAPPPQPAAKAEMPREIATGETAEPPEADVPVRHLAAREDRTPVRSPSPRAGTDDPKRNSPQPLRAVSGQSGVPARIATTPVPEGTKLQPTLKAEAPPALPFASLVQVGHAIAAEVAQIDLAAAGTDTGAPTALAPRTEDAPTAGPVRVLDIALSPESLGRVVVHMRLTAQGLTVRLKADNPATAELLAGDKDRLSALLGSSGLPGVDLEVGGPGLSLIDAPVHSLATMEGWHRPESMDDARGGGRGNSDPGRQGRNNNRQDTFSDDDAAPSFADEPRAGAG